MILKNHKWKIAFLAASLLVGILLVCFMMEKKTVNEKNDIKRADNEKNDIIGKDIKKNDNKETDIDENTTENVRATKFEERPKIVPKPSGAIDHKLIFSEEDYFYIKKMDKNFTKEDIYLQLQMFDTFLPPFSPSKECKIKHNLSDSEIKSLIEPSESDLKSGKITGDEIYNIYIKIRRYAMALSVGQRKKFWYHEDNKVVSMFTKSDEFFELVKDTKDLFGKNEELNIFKKIKIYVYYILMAEMSYIYEDNRQLINEYKQYSVGNAIEIGTITNKILTSIYNSKCFEKYAKGEPFYLISFIELQNMIFGKEEVSKAGPEKINKCFMKIKDEFPYLNLINNISISYGNKVVLPFNYVDRIINAFLKKVFFKFNK
ncbi:hypothetical protein NGRA_1393 [Nosema granulosis]|uniref:Uncharacterized protein n=1 Tax=Nosema granulosis TaxID=83296 RepID=A0A9P6KZ55_9MICR|nr:hypothetical protein NGRA_1393 [Nosema granulosis]